MTRLRVGMDGRAFESPAAGVRRYVHELTRALVALDRPLALVALGGGVLPDHVERVPEPWHPPTNLGWTLVGIPRAASRAALDVYHGPAYTAPPLGVRPLVLTLHDVSYERHPEWYPHRRDRLRRWFYGAAARTADIVITDSEFSRGEIVAAYGLPADRVQVIPLGVSDMFRPALTPGSLPQGVTVPFVLHVGDLHARRSVDLALDAVLQLRARATPRDVTLVLAGIDRGSLAALAARAAAAGDPAALLALGSVDDGALVALYQQATALVYPSRYEGFGLPLVEAMACGTPVVAARAGPAEEVTADAADLLPPSDRAAWTEAIARLLADRPHAERMRRRGLERAAGFTWRRTAEATYAVYQACARRR